jgi:DNA replication licensing factor MCM4
VRSSRSSGPGASTVNASRRGDIHSDSLGPSSSRRRRLFVDENGLPVRDEIPNSDAATFSNLDPNTSDAEALGGSSTRIIWGTNISIQDTMASFKNFLLNFQKKYRMWAEGVTEAETRPADHPGNVKEYVQMMRNMRQLGVTGLNLDVRNLKVYPATLKLWHQLQAYPHEIIPLMDQSVKDLMVEQAEAEMNELRSQQQQRGQGRTRARNGSSVPPVPSSDMAGSAGEAQQAPAIPDLVRDVEIRTYKVKPFGLDKAINMRDLNPNGQSC